MTRAIPEPEPPHWLDKSSLQIEGDFTLLSAELVGQVEITLDRDQIQSLWNSLRYSVGEAVIVTGLLDCAVNDLIERILPEMDPDQMAKWAECLEHASCRLRREASRLKQEREA